jgi:hypothetical protein
VLEDWHCASISEIATAETIDHGYVGSILRLTLLAPDIVEAILHGQQPVDLGLPRLLKPFPLEWSEQRTRPGCANRCCAMRGRRIHLVQGRSVAASIILRGQGDRRVRCRSATHSWRIGW